MRHNDLNPIFYFQLSYMYKNVVPDWFLRKNNSDWLNEKEGEKD